MISISPDQMVFWSWHGFELNATIVFTWGVMAILVVGSMLLTRRLTDDERPSHWQNALEVIVGGLRSQVREVGGRHADRSVPFIGTLFLFIGLSNLLPIVPGFEPPTGSLSTTAALALCVLVAVPIYGIRQRGLWGYLRGYLRPTPFMLPFNLMGEFTRTIALAVRLYGNIMSGVVIVAILLTLTPFIFPAAMELLHLLTGMVQAFIFAVLATVYIAAAESTDDGATKAQEQGPPRPPAS